MCGVPAGVDSLRWSVGYEQPTLFFTGSCLSRSRTGAALRTIGRNPSDLSQRRWQSDLCGKMEQWSFGDSGGTIFGLFWRMSTDVDVEGYHSMYGDVDARLTKESVLVGLSLLPEVTEVTCLFYSMENEVEDLKPVEEITLPVGENGFFHEKMDFPQEKADMFYVGYVEGRTSAGEVVYRKGLGKDGKEYDVEGHQPQISSVGGWAYEDVKERKARP